MTDTVVRDNQEILSFRTKVEDKQKVRIRNKENGAKFGPETFVSIAEIQNNPNVLFSYCCTVCIHVSLQCLDQLQRSVDMAQKMWEQARHQSLQEEEWLSKLENQVQLQVQDAFSQVWFD